VYAQIETHTVAVSKAPLCYIYFMEDQHKHFVGPVAQKAILARDGKVLITRDAGDKDTWELLGGDYT